MENKKLIVTEEMEIEIPKAGMVIKFDGEKVLLGFVTNTDIVVDGDLRIATKGDFEVVSVGDAILSTLNEGKVRLGYAEKIHEERKKREIE